MGALKKYNPKQVSITFKGKSLKSGIVAGTFIEISRAERNSSLNVGGDGGATMVINNNRSATVTLTQRAGSDTNEDLSDWVLADEADNGVKNVGTLQIKDMSGNSLHIDEEAFLDGPADAPYGIEESERVWTFQCPNMTIDSRGNNAASDTGTSLG